MPCRKRRQGYHRRQGSSICARHRLSGAGQGQVRPSFFWPRPASLLDPWHCRPGSRKSWETNRNPMLLFELFGLFLLRSTQRALS